MLEGLRNGLLYWRLTSVTVWRSGIDSSAQVTGTFISILRGKDFRKDYARLWEFRRLSACPVIVLTATATTSMMNIIVQRVGLKDPVFVLRPINRSNI